MKEKVSIFWFRRDLRLNDNAGLYQALAAGTPVIPLFIFDRNILDQLEDKKDRRVTFIHAALLKMQEELVKIDSSLEVYYGFPGEVFSLLAEKYNIASVFINGDYEPYALKRDKEVAEIVQGGGGQFLSYKDQVVFEKNEVLKDDGTPYTVYSPYSRKWKNVLQENPAREYLSEKLSHNFFRQPPFAIPSLESIGFIAATGSFPGEILQNEVVSSYHDTRDFPGIENGTSKIGVHLRFGTVSVRKVVASALLLNQTFLNELIWREFYQMILWHFPRVGEGKAFKPAFDNIAWRNNEQEFELWCQGKTGYPLVDAGIRQLNATGFMHNRVRMVTASFLTKHLLIDWRWGEAYFSQKLLDYDLASNNGGWQWAAGCGCDAAPYFRVFNPTIQLKKFDKGYDYVRKWIPELDDLSYPAPIVAHEFARNRALAAYGKAVVHR